MAQNPSKVVEVATSQLGYLEKKSNKDLDSKTANAGSKNYTKYGAWFGINPVLWCDVFVCWCFNQAYGSIAKEMLCGGYSAACETTRQRFIKAGRYDQTPEVASCVFFSGTRHAGANHIELVIKVTASKIYTIGGNTSGASGVIDNGGGVAQKSYSRSYSRIMGYGHPNFDVEETTTSTPVTQKPVSKPATTEKKKVIEEDGEWGKATTRLAQKVFGTEVDGIVSRQIMKYHSNYLPNCLSSSWQFFETPSKYKGGSQLIKAIQDWCDADVDGLCGPGTVSAIQAKLGVKVDKVMGPETVTAFQEYLNEKA